MKLRYYVYDRQNEDGEPLAAFNNKSEADKYARQHYGFVIDANTHILAGNLTIDNGVLRLDGQDVSQLLAKKIGVNLSQKPYSLGRIKITIEPDETSPDVEAEIVSGS